LATGFSATPRLSGYLFAKDLFFTVFSDVNAIIVPKETSVKK
jgi:hypothetical protein